MPARRKCLGHPEGVAVQREDHADGLTDRRVVEQRTAL
jgi:hypothetical protein